MQLLRPTNVEQIVMPGCNLVTDSNANETQYTSSLYINGHIKLDKTNTTPYLLSNPTQFRPVQASSSSRCETSSSLLLQKEAPCTDVHTRKSPSGLLQLPAMTGKPRRWWPFKSNPCPNVIQIRHFLPCPNAQQQCNKLRLPGHLPAPPATTPKPSNISSKYAQMAPNLRHTTLAKLANALHTQPEAASLPPVQYHNHDTPENGNKTLPSAQEAGKTHTAGLQTSRISPRFRYTPLLNNLDHDLALGNAETEDWSGGKQSFRGGETMGLEQMSLPRYPPVAAPPTLRSRPPTVGFFPPDHRSPSIRWSRMTVCPSSVTFTHRT